MQPLPHFTDIIPQYDGFLIDLWGVVHDGTSLYDGVRASFEALKAANKSVVMLSNAPRRAARSIEALNDLGIERSLYTSLHTSGEASYQNITQHRAHQHCYYLGPEEDADIMDGLPVTRTTCLGDADFIYNIGHYYAFQPLEELHEELQEMQACNLPMLCANPDIDVVKMDGTRYPCAGEIAAHYERIGGTVEYFGKPHPLVYAQARAMLGLPDTARLLGIGDNLATDIAGAHAAGIDALLIAGGVLHADALGVDGALYLPGIEAATRKSGVTPTYVCAGFGVIW